MNRVVVVRPQWVQVGDGVHPGGAVNVGIADQGVAGAGQRRQVGECLQVLVVDDDLIVFLTHQVAVAWEVVPGQSDADEGHQACGGGDPELPVRTPRVAPSGLPTSPGDHQYRGPGQCDPGHRREQHGDHAR